MAEAIKTKENLFKKIYRKIRRRGQPYPPPYARNRKKDDEEEENKREEAQAQREADQVARDAQHAVQTVPRDTVTKRTKQPSSQETRQRSNEGQVRLKQAPEPPQIPITDDIQNERIRDALSLYEDRRRNGGHVSPEDMQQLFQQISEAITDPEIRPNPREIQYIRANILEPLQVAIPAYEQAVAIHRQQQNNEAMQDREWYDPRTGFLHEVYVPGTDTLAKDSDVIADRDLRDIAFDRLFAVADAQPDQQFQQAFDQLYDQQKYKGFIDLLLKASQETRHISEAAVRKYREIHELPEDTPRETVLARIKDELKQDLERYKLERRVREIVHNANFALDVPNIKAEQVYGFVDGFSSELIDYVWRMPGVRDMMNIYENQLRKAMWDRDGYLDPEDVRRYVRTNITDLPGGKSSRRNEVRIPEIEKETKRLFEEYVGKKGVYVRSDDGEKREWTEDRDKLKDHEVDRIFTTARGMMVLSMRMLSLASESKIPPNGQYTSLFLQDVMQSYAPFVHLLAKYNVPSYKALSMLLTEPDRDKTVFGKIRKPWMAKQMAGVAHVLENGGQGARDILDGRFGEMLQIRRLNPALCGDAFGFLSWRAGEDPGDITGTELFLRIGEEKMRGRLAHVSTTDEAAYLREYGNWIGTGFRMERLRGGINAELAEGKKDGPNVEKAKALLERMVDLQPGRVFFKSYKVQHRLNQGLEDVATQLGYTESVPVDAIKPERRSSLMMQHVSDNLLFLESKMHQMREELLDDGFTFEGTGGTKAVTLDEIMSRIQAQGIVLPHNDARDIEAMQRFRDLMSEDFDAYKDREGHWEKEDDHHGGTIRTYTSGEEGYHQEFIYKREYNHAFTLWSGDAPVDEFNMAAVGPTGGFSRRARENQSIGEANGLIIGLLADLKYIRTPDEAFGHLTKIYNKISDYDASKAKETVTYLSEGLLKLFGSTGLAKIPIIGGAVKTWPGAFRGAFNTLGKIPVVGKPFEYASGYMTGSAAQQIFDNPRMPVWHATEMRYFIQNLLYEKGYIGKAQLNELANHMTARKWDVQIDFLDTMGPLLAIAILIWLLKESSEDV